MNMVQMYLVELSWNIKGLLGLTPSRVTAIEQDQDFFLLFSTGSAQEDRTSSQHD